VVLEEVEIQEVQEVEVQEDIEQIFLAQELH
jgi:hypothetical protein